MKTTRAWVVLVLAAALLLAAPAWAETVSDVLVRFRSGVSTDAIEQLKQSVGVVESTVSPYTGVHVVTIPDGLTADELVSCFAGLSEVEYAEPNGFISTALVPNDTYYRDSRDFQWNFKYIGMEQTWQISRGSPDTIIAVIDTGVAYEDYGIFRLAPDLAATVFVPGYDFVNDDSHPNDDHGHGTHVTGTIAQTTNNAFGVAGIAHNCAIMPLKVLNQSGSGNFNDLADALIYATDHGADIVNMSLGANDYSSGVASALEYAHSHGVTLVAATGNDNELSGTAIDFPARDPNVIAVGATRWDNAVTWYSNKGPQIDIVAPGGDLGVDQDQNGFGDGILQNDFNPRTKDVDDFGFWFFHGTSMATPHAAAVAALLHERGITTPEGVRTVLRKTALDLGTSGFDQTSGYGLLNALAALSITLPLPGDANEDGRIDGQDLSVWQQNYDPLGVNDNALFFDGDWNLDGHVDGADLALWQQGYRPYGFGDFIEDAQNVPEPGTLTLFALTALTALGLRRRGVRGPRICGSRSALSLLILILPAVAVLCVLCVFA